MEPEINIREAPESVEVIMDPPMEPTDAEPPQAG